MPLALSFLQTTANKQKGKKKLSSWESHFTQKLRPWVFSTCT